MPKEKKGQVPPLDEASTTKTTSTTSKSRAAAQSRSSVSAKTPKPAKKATAKAKTSATTLAKAASKADEATTASAVKKPTQRAAKKDATKAAATVDEAVALSPTQEVAQEKQDKKQASKPTKAKAAKALAPNAPDLPAKPAAKTAAPTPSKRLSKKAELSSSNSAGAEVLPSSAPTPARKTSAAKTASGKQTSRKAKGNIQFTAIAPDADLSASLPSATPDSATTNLEQSAAESPVVQKASKPAKAPRKTKGIPTVSAIPTEAPPAPRKVASTDLTTDPSVERLEATTVAKGKRGRKPKSAADTATPNIDTPNIATPTVAAVIDAASLPAEERADLESGAEPALLSAEAQNTAAQVTELPTPDRAASPQVSDHEVIELITAQLRKMGRPVHVRDFERSFTRVGREKLGQRDLGKWLEELTRSGVVIRTRRNTYGLPEAMNLVRGRFQASNSGFGFVIPDSGGDDFYIREGETLEAWNGDIVLVRPEGRNFERPERYKGRNGNNRGKNSRNDSPRAAVIRIVSRAYSRLVGSLEYLKGYAFLKPDDHRARHRIMLVQSGTETLPAGARVVAQLFWPEDTGEDEVYGEVARVLGAEDDPETETQAVIVKYGLHNEFPPEVQLEAEKIPGKVPASATNGRLDLREYNIFTVDGSDAKDFDDAIHIQATPEGTFVVGIHIADVSHYVRPGTALDSEAYDRATSVYLPGNVLPMLPEHLSNGVCSLVPYEDRLTMSAMIELSGDGDILNTQFSPSVIRSKARLTYDEVQAYSEASATLPEHARALEGDLHLLLKITAKLRQKRLREGSLDFKMREVKVDIGKGGEMQLIPLHEETARGMIEDLMLLANKTVAHFLLEKNVPTLFRIHEEPTLGRFQEVSAALGRMGLSFPGGQPTPQAYQAVLKEVRGTSQESVVNTLLLRSMQQAKYAEENLGHFGLAFEEYLHFTSPIRRYPDLLVHRALKLALNGDVSDHIRAELAAPLAEQGRHTSERERNAAEAERDLTKYYQAKWAETHLNESFEGRVSGVIASGLFVALENGVEGRLHISNLDDDYYVYIEEASILKGRSNGRSYRIGDTIQVNISKVNPLARQIDFTQENTMEGNDHKPRARRREDRETQKREKLSSFLPQTSAQAAAEQSASAETQAPDTAEQRQGYQRREGYSGTRRDGIRRDDSRAGRNYSSHRPQSSSNGSAPSGYRRRVITLERPRNEHLRPVNITVQRMYFGDWTLDNLPPEETSGERSYRSGGSSSFRGRSSDSRERGSRPPRDHSPRASREGGHPPRDHQASRDQAAANQPMQGAPTGSDSDEAKRRRRRRGRRGGSNNSENGNTSSGSGE